MVDLHRDVVKAAGTVSPANATGPAAKPMVERKRIPMSLPTLRLQVPEGCCPGYHLHWFMGTPDRIQRALDAGYEYVTRDEVYLNNKDLAGDASKTGNTDLGNGVSIVAGGDSIDGQATRLHLMKIRQEWYDEDQAVLAKRNQSIADALVGGTMKSDQSPETPGDMSKRYLDKRTKIPDMFIPKQPKGAR